MLKKYKNGFLEYLEKDLGRAEMTVRNYDRYLTRFIAWLDGQKIVSPGKITKPVMQKYKNWLKDFRDEYGQPLKVNTYNYHLVALRMFFVYLERRRVKTIAPEDVDLQKFGARKIVFLTDKEVLALREAPKDFQNDLMLRLRDKVVLEILLATGLKVAELVNLSRKDSKKMSLPQQARYWVSKFLEKRQDKNPALLVRYDRAGNIHQANKLTARSVQRIVARYAKFAGISKEVTPQVLRHTFAKNLFNKGLRITQIQKRLGYESHLATKIYLSEIRKELFKP